MFSVLAQARPGFLPLGWGFGEMIIAIIIICAIVAIAYIALRHFGIAIPSWAVAMFWVVVVAFCAIFAIRILLSM